MKVPQTAAQLPATSSAMSVVSVATCHLLGTVCRMSGHPEVNGGGGGGDELIRTHVLSNPEH